MNQEEQNYIDIGLLARKYLNGTATEEEQALLHQWYQEEDGSDVLLMDISPAEFEAIGSGVWDNLKSKIQRPVQTVIRKKKAYHRQLAAAFLLLMLGAWGSYSIVKVYTRVERGRSTAAFSTSDILPGKDGAILTLANNRKLNLDELGNGIVIKEEGVEIVKNGNEINYVVLPQTKEQVGFNTISTARGQKFKITLPDGTIASLDAASSLQFPEMFVGNERRVSVKGQVYFDVAHNEKNAFIVQGDGFEVKVLGTRFNINAYEEESASRITLLQGSVKMSESKTGVTQTLVPGNQAIIDNTGKMTVVPQADIETAMAWYEGAFQFRDTEVRQVLTQLGRWYQVEVDIQLKKGEERYFTGRISRNSSLNTVLEILRLSDVNFKLENNKLIVYP